MQKSQYSKEVERERSSERMAGQIHKRDWRGFSREAGMRRVMQMRIHLAENFIKQLPMLTAIASQGLREARPSGEESLRRRGGPPG